MAVRAVVARARGAARRQAASWWRWRAAGAALRAARPGARARRGRTARGRGRSQRLVGAGGDRAVRRERAGDGAARTVDGCGERGGADGAMCAVDGCGGADGAVRVVDGRGDERREHDGGHARRRGGRNACSSPRRADGGRGGVPVSTGRRHVAAGDPGSAAQPSGAQGSATAAGSGRRRRNGSCTDVDGCRPRLPPAAGAARERAQRGPAAASGERSPTSAGGGPCR